MSLAVILLNWNHAADTAACLQALPAMDPPLAAIVVDNASRPEQQQRLRDAGPGAELVFSPRNLGFAGGNNLGLRHALAAGHDTVLLLNHDARISAAALTALVRHLDTHPDTAIAGPVLRETTPAGPARYAGGRDMAFHAATRCRLPASWTPPPGAMARDVAYVPGTVLLARAQTFKTAGFFDEEFFFSGEVADFCCRVRRSGGACRVVWAAEAEHRVDAANPLRETIYAYYTLRNRFLYLRKHYPVRRFVIAPAWLAIGTAMMLRARLQARPDQARALRLALADGLAGRFGNRNHLFLGPEVGT